MVDGVIVAWFSSAFPSEHVEELQTARGKSKCHQSAEAVAIPIGVRAWSQYWHDLTLVLTVCSDSVTAKMKASRVGANKIARELTLTLSDSAVRPQFREHLPGVANVVANVLRRRCALGRMFVMLVSFAKVPEKNRCILEDFSQSSGVVGAGFRQTGIGCLAEATPVRVSCVCHPT